MCPSKDIVARNRPNKPIFKKSPASTIDTCVAASRWAFGNQACSHSTGNFKRIGTNRSTLDRESHWLLPLIRRYPIHGIAVNTVSTTIIADTSSRSDWYPIE